MHPMKILHWIASIWRFAVYTFPRKRKPPTITTSPPGDWVVASARTDDKDGLWVFNAEK